MGWKLRKAPALPNQVWALHQNCQHVATQATADAQQEGPLLEGIQKNKLVSFEWNTLYICTALTPHCHTGFLNRGHQSGQLDSSAEPAALSACSSLAGFVLPCFACHLRSSGGCFYHTMCHPKLH